MPHDRKLFSLDSLAMYTVTLLSEVPLILARAIIVYLTAAFILLAKGDPHPDPGSSRTSWGISRAPTAGSRRR